MLKEFLPKVLSAEYLQSFGKLTQLEQGTSFQSSCVISVVVCEIEGDKKLLHSCIDKVCA